MSLCVIHTPISWNYGHPKPTFVFLGCPLLFDNMFVCPRSAPFDSLSFSMLSFYLFPLSLHVHAWSMDTWSKGATSQAQVKRAWMQTRRERMQAKRCKPTKGNVQQIRRSSLPKWLYLSPSLLASYLEHCIKVPPLLVPFIFPVPLWAIPLGHWQCLFTFVLCVIALCMMHETYIYIYICIYMPLCVWVIMHFVQWTLVAT